MKTPEEIEKFVADAVNATPPLDRMALAYKNAVKTTEEQQARLLSHLRARDGQPFFRPEVKEVEPDLKAAEAAEAEMRARISEYLDLVGEYGSIRAISERLARLKRQADNVKFEADNALKQAINRGVEHPEADQQAMAAADRRDRVLSEVSGQIADLAQRVKRAKELVGDF